MALDLYASALRFEGEELLSCVDEVQNRGWKTIWRAGSALTLVRSGASQTVCLGGHSIYGRLEEAGVLCVSGAVRDGAIRLSGGSVSTCSLLLHDGPSVMKTVAGSPVGDADGRDRHHAEAQWMANMATVEPGLFPGIQEYHTGDPLLIKSDFFPAYTLGELFVQGRSTLAQATALLTKAFGRMGEALYQRNASGPQETYADKVSRRFALLLGRSELAPTLDELFLRGGTINGVDCRPIGDLLRLMTSDRTTASLLICKSPRQCHGDFIPEDILYSSLSGEFRLIDPNPQIQDPLCDVAKMMMSLMLAYDLAIRDEVSIASCRRGGGIEITTSIDPKWKSYIILQSALAEWMLDNLVALTPPGSIEDRRLERPTVMLLAGLQAMALPVFHSLHHGKHDRALYFLAKGHLTCELAIRSILA